MGRSGKEMGWQMGSKNVYKIWTGSRMDKLTQKKQLMANYVYPSFWSDVLVHVPKMESSCLKADSVQMQKRPTWPPGANLRRLRRSTEMRVIPGMFLNALVMPLSLSYITNGPLF